MKNIYKQAFDSLQTSLKMKKASVEEGLKNDKVKKHPKSRMAIELNSTLRDTVLTLNTMKVILKGCKRLNNGWLEKRINVNN